MADANRQAMQAALVELQTALASAGAGAADMRSTIATEHMARAMIKIGYELARIADAAAMMQVKL